MPKNPDKNILFDKIPSDGTPVGNVTLRSQLKWDDEKYWNVRNELLEEGMIGLGRGKGGSVFRLKEVSETVSKVEPKLARYKRERDLYPPFKKVIEEKFTRDMNLKNFVCEITGYQGRRYTGGKWTRPDVILISVTTYPYVPGKVMDIITFEVKLAKSFEITGVFETAAHSRFATKSYYCVHLPNGWDDNSPEFDRIKSECDRFGIGLMHFEEPKNYDTYEVLVEPTRRNPDPSEMDSFISTQMGDEAKKKLSEFLH